MSRRGPTPGPWRVQAGLVVSDAPVPRVVAQTYSPASLARWPEDAAERDANARLIAAAPDMAEALRRILGDLAITADETGRDPCDVSPEAIEAAMVALAKAAP
jgi:hypothetical protein